MAVSKEVARFREWLNIPFHYFKVSLVVWKLKHFLIFGLWELLCCHFIAANQHIPGIPMPGFGRGAVRGQAPSTRCLDAWSRECSTCWEQETTPGQVVHTPWDTSSFAISAAVAERIWAADVSWDFQISLRTTKTSLGYKTWSKDLGSITQIVFEDQGCCVSMWSPALSVFWVWEYVSSLWWT